jgi:hypothetical protein
MTEDRQYKYIYIKESSTETKTKRWLVLSKQFDDRLGVIKWHGSWRSYAFFPDDETLFEHNCLWDIADFVAKETSALRETWKKRKSCPVPK